MSITVDSSLVTVDGEIVGLTLPDAVDVRAGVEYGASGTEFTGTLIVGSGSSATPEEIAAAVVAALQATTIPVDTQKMNGSEIIGDGSVANPWRGVGVSP